MKRTLLNVNGVDRWVVAEKTATLADVLREQMLLTGCKVCCEDGQCGSCTVIVDGKPDRSCQTTIEKLAPGAKIVTIEGVGTAEKLHPLQVAWMAHGGAQCGVCTPGFIMSAKVLLDNNKSPTREQVRSWFNRNRNLCRCTGYKPLVDAVMDAAAIMRGEKTAEQVLAKPKADGSILGTRYQRPSALAKVTGHVGLRRRPRPAHAARHAASGAGAGQGLARQHQGHRRERSREDAGRRQGHHLEGRQGQERDHRPHHLPDQQGRRLGSADPVQGEGVPVRRRDRHRRRRYGGTRPRGGRQGEGRSGSAAGLHVRLRGARARRDGDPSRRAERVLRAGRREGRRHQAVVRQGEGVGRHHHLLQPPAASASGAGLRRRLRRRRRRVDDPVEEHRRASASRDDLPRHRHRAGEAAS